MNVRPILLILPLLLSSCYVYNWTYDEFPERIEYDSYGNLPPIRLYVEAAGTSLTGTALEESIYEDLLNSRQEISRAESPEESNLLISMTGEFRPAGWSDVPIMIMSIAGLGILPHIHLERESTVTIQFSQPGGEVLVSSYRLKYRMITALYNLQLYENRNRIEQDIALATLHQFLNELDEIRDNAVGPTYKTLITARGRYSMVRLNGEKVILPDGTEREIRGQILSRTVLRNPISLLY